MKRFLMLSLALPLLASAQTISFEFPSSQVTNVIFRFRSATNVAGPYDPFIAFGVEFTETRPNAFYLVDYAWRTNVFFDVLPPQSAPIVKTAGSKTGKL